MAKLPPPHPFGVAVRRVLDYAFRYSCALCALSALLILAVLLIRIAIDGTPQLTWDFVNNFPSRRPADAGLKAALLGTIWLMGVVLLTAVPIGVAAAVYLEEFTREGRLNRLIEVNISNLAGVPSIVYGILGLTLFARIFGFGFSILTGGLTLSLLVLPIIIVASREAIRAVPQSHRTASYALGATKLQTVLNVVLPQSIPGIITGVILALSRAIGETAPLIVAGAATFLAFTPSSPMDQYTALPIQIYDWISRPQKEFQDLAASGIVVMLALVFTMNAIATLIRSRFGRQAR